MPKIIAVTCLFFCISLHGQQGVFYPSADCSNGKITHCYVGVERPFMFLQDYDTILSMTANNAVINHFKIKATKPGKVILKAKAIAKSHDTIAIADTLQAITQPEIELRIISTKNNNLKFGFFDKKTGKNYLQKEFENCFFEVAIYNEKSKAVDSSVESGWIYNVGSVKQGYTILIRAFPLDKRTGWAFKPIEIKYKVP